MEKIAVIGMGIIGGSICASLTRAGYEVDGFGRSEKSVLRAIEKGYIRRQGADIADYDVVFIAVPPQATLDYLRNGKFKDGALVMDICGVKQAPERAVYETERNYRYVGIHPMAGKETSGIDSASPDLFKGANLIITHAPQTQSQDVAKVKEYAQKMGFGTIVECTAEEHDKKIALTSQLAHIVSNAYVKSPQVQGCHGFTGGSFQDMTRIAGVDEHVWTPLYACNRENIVRELNGLIEHLSAYRDALTAGDDERTSELLREGRLIRETIRRPND
ncbi:MAG: prephenate dehydrogenase/arogenate dehydrogenase family protein [Clostridiales bacterium]|nr:prephenate dehydrogenase/arogenate dehydrogenase family protein [Clostridiales bacterium]